MPPLEHFSLIDSSLLQPPKEILGSSFDCMSVWQNEQTSLHNPQLVHFVNFQF